MDYGTLINTQNGKIAEAQDQYNTASQSATTSKANLDNYAATQKSAQDIYSAAENAFGVAGARETAGKAKQALNLTQGLINNLPNSITGRTQGSLVNESQRQRLLANEMNPLQAQYQAGSSAYSDQQGLLQDLMGQAGAQSGREYQSQSDKYNQLRDMYGQAYAEKVAAQDQIKQRQEMLNWYVGQQETARQFEAQMALKRQEMADARANAARQLQISQSQNAQSRQDQLDREAKMTAIQKEADRLAKNRSAKDAAYAANAKVADVRNNPYQGQDFFSQMIGNHVSGRKFMGLF